jgi:hypothetical protein
LEWKRALERDGTGQDQAPIFGVGRETERDLRQGQASVLAYECPGREPLGGQPGRLVLEVPAFGPARQRVSGRASAVLAERLA